MLVVYVYTLLCMRIYIWLCVFVRVCIPNLWILSKDIKCITFRCIQWQDCNVKMKTRLHFYQNIIFFSNSKTGLYEQCQNITSFESLLVLERLRWMCTYRFHLHILCTDPIELKYVSGAETAHLFLRPCSKF